MFKVLTKDFIYNPVLEMKIEEPTEEIQLFGKTYRMYKDEWKHHIHLKITNMCDAKCAFCIEKGSRDDYENAIRFHESAKLLIQNMHTQGHLKTISITGGEPTLSPVLQDTIRMCLCYEPKLLSINTNGYAIGAIEPNTFKGWLNISKHRIDDRAIFKRSWNLDSGQILAFKERQENANVRLQCVLGVKGGLESQTDIDNFIDHFKDCADDFSFRSLIIESAQGSVDPLFWDFRDKLFQSGCLEEQAIQDYYVYEIYNYKGKKVTLSWSNMALLKNHNETHKDNFLEEIIVHPDGKITGSWNKKTLKIYNPYAPEKCRSCKYLDNGCRHRSSSGGCSWGVLPRGC